MKIVLACLAAAAAASLAFLAGCDKEIARTKETQIKDDGTVKTEEKTVTEHPDGSRTVTEEETKSVPDPD
jgi:hypothetical protein